MQLFFYPSGGDKDRKRLQAAVHKVIPEGRIEHFKALPDLQARLRTPVAPNSVAVLAASSLEELQNMQVLRGLLTEIYVVLVIPDRKKSTIKLAHRLLPRFLSPIDSDFEDLKTVLNRMYLNSQESDDRKSLKEA